MEEEDREAAGVWDTYALGYAMVMASPVRPIVLSHLSRGPTDRSPFRPAGWWPRGKLRQSLPNPKQRAGAQRAGEARQRCILRVAIHVASQPLPWAHP